MDPSVSPAAGGAACAELEVGPGWVDAICPAGSRRVAVAPLVGAFHGDGVGSELVPLALGVAGAACRRAGVDLEVRLGGVIGIESVGAGGEALPGPATEFCEEVFAGGGAVLAGPGGGRFVYDLRKRFDLYCKVNPIRPVPELAGVGPVRGGPGEAADILVVRENVGGLYQAGVEEESGAAGGGGRSLRVEISYTEADVRRIVEAGVRLAAGRSGRVTVVYKDSGMPAMSAFWKGIAEDVAGERGLAELRFADVDYCAYQLVREPEAFDVVVAPNCFGDILADVGGLLMASRGMTWGASFSEDGKGVYQTNHGAAFDLAGSDSANPLGQVLSAAGMLRHSLQLDLAAGFVEAAVSAVLQDGFRTADIAGDGCRTVGTREMCQRVLDHVAG